MSKYHVIQVAGPRSCFPRDFCISCCSFSVCISLSSVGSREYPQYAEFALLALVLAVELCIAPVEILCSLLPYATCYWYEQILVVVSQIISRVSGSDSLHNSFHNSSKALN